VSSIAAPPIASKPSAVDRAAGSPRRHADPLAIALAALVTAALVALSAYLRTRIINGQFWMDEGLSVGIASHPLTDIPHVLRSDGSPPLYYMLLHAWMSAFGRTEADTHWLSLIFSLATIPSALWAGWSLWGRRAGYIGAVLCTVNPFLDVYGEETRMYSLMALLALLATACFLHAFVYRRRGYLIPFALLQTLMLYTHGWGIFYGLGAAIALLVLIRQSDEPRRLLLDGVYAFGAAAVLFLPWLPTLLYQSGHTGAPWSKAPRLGAPIQISRGLLGGDRAAVALLLVSGFGLATLLRSGGRDRDRRAIWTMLIVTVATLAIAWVVSHISPAWTTRYFAVVLGPILLLAALGVARAKVLGIAAMVFVIAFWFNPNQFTSSYKSDVRDIGAEVGSSLRPGDLVIVGQPEQTPLAWYYLPAGLRYATTVGTVADPRYMNWSDALDRLRAAEPATTLGPLLARLAAGQHVLFVRPLTEGVQNWDEPWTQLVRRRSAQWGEILASDPTFQVERTAPQFYRGGATVGNSAVLYVKRPKAT
jgi:mannosyltransferase